MKHKLFESVRYFLRWLFGAPFVELPPEFGDSIPPELRIFEVKTEEIQRHPRGSVPRVRPTQKV